MLKAYKYRLLPTDQQAELINNHIGSCRLVYNLALEVKSYAYLSQGVNLSHYDLISQLPQLKEVCGWLNQIDSQALQQAVMNLDKAFAQFFKGQSSFPRYKNKSDGRSFRHPHGFLVKIKEGKLYQPKFRDGIRVIIDRPIKGKIKNTTITRTNTGKYFVSVLAETKDTCPAPKPINEQSSIGIDLGIKDLVVTSVGDKIGNPKYLKQSLGRLRFLYRRASKKKRGSANSIKTYQKLTLLYEKIMNQRKDFLHKLSTQLIKSHDTLCFEDLRVQNMSKNRKLSRAISDSGWGMLIQMCEYKADWYGKNILQISTFAPSTKLCSVCSQKNDMLTLADREWVCAGCGTLHDRDINAAVNIKNIALASRGGVHRGKPVEPPALVGAEKQELLTIKTISKV